MNAGLNARIRAGVALWRRRRAMGALALSLTLAMLAQGFTGGLFSARGADTLVSVPRGETAVSLQLRQANVRDAFEMLARQSGLNLLLGKGVRGRISASLERVTLNQALSYLMLLTGASFAQVDNGSTLLITASSRALTAFSPESELRTRSIRYRRAADIVRQLEETLHANALDGPTPLRVSADPAANRLIMAGTPQALARVDKTIAQLDTPLPQRAYAVKSGNPARLARLMAAFFASGTATGDSRQTEFASGDVDTPVSVSGLTIIPDARAQTLTVQGNAEQLALIDSWMLAHDRPARSVSLSVRMKALPVKEAQSALEKSLRQGPDSGILSPEAMHLIGWQPQAGASVATDGFSVQTSAAEETRASLEWDGLPARAGYARGSSLGLELTPSVASNDGAIWLTVRPTIRRSADRARSYTLPGCRLLPGQTFAFVIPSDDPRAKRSLMLWITPRLQDLPPDGGPDYRRYSAAPPVTRLANQRLDHLGGAP
ncbi:MAG: hypothetical protein IPK79_09710 [Vampirovibrionales bacterium]|nr:hypothetical protein [Vampirovibrionales bacterium]